MLFSTANQHNMSNQLLNKHTNTSQEGTNYAQPLLWGLKSTTATDHEYNNLKLGEQFSMQGRQNVEIDLVSDWQRGSTWSYMEEAI